MRRAPETAVAAIDGVLRAYQLTLSAVIGRQCRFLPTCSDFAREALARHGLVRGGRLAMGRVCRCGPRLPVALDWQTRTFGPSHGWDPVPECRAPADNR